MPVGYRMERGRTIRQESLALVQGGKDGAWTRVMAVERKLNGCILGVEPASLADRLGEIMREREASKMTPRLGCH